MSWLLWGRDTWTPPQMGNLTLWLNASTIVGLNNGDPVIAWEDQSGNNNDFSQANAARRPTYRMSVINGEPVVRFDGTDDHLESANVLGSVFFSTNQVDIFVVLLQVGTQGNNSTFQWESAVDTNRITGLFTWGNNFIFDFDRVAGGRSVAAQPGGWDDAFHLVEAMHAAGGNQIIDVDGTNLVTNNYAITLDVTQMAVLYLGNNTPGGGSPFKGDIAEFMIYNISLNAADRANIEQHFQDKYNLTIA